MSIAAAGLILTGIAVIYAIVGPRPGIKPTADALLDPADFLSVSVQARRSSVTIIAVEPVVFFDPTGRDPGQTQPILNTSRVAPSGSIALDANQTQTFGITLTMEPQLLPGPNGSARVMRPPRREEIRVRIDYGRKKQLFVQPKLVDFVVEHNDDK
jgi:hypothetical protein